MREVAREQARAIAVQAQLLDAHRPSGLLDMVRRLTLLQVDPTAAVAPNADLVSWTRLGASYSPAQLTQALEVDRTLFEHNAYVRPVEDLGLHLADMATWPSRDTHREWLRSNDAFRRDVLALLGERGPLLSRDIPDTSSVGWRSTGWTHNRNVTQMLEFLMMRGEVAIAGRRGRQRLWDLPERVYPADVEVVPADQARRERNARRLRSLGIARGRGAKMPTEPVDVDDVGEVVRVEGVAGVWRVDPDALERPFKGRTALLSPFDRLVYDRVRAQELFGFEYHLEMYKPKAARRWGYFALPVLHGTSLVGKLDVRADRTSGRLVVNALHEDVTFSRAMRDAVQDEVEQLASWLGLTVGGRTGRDG